jgi:hypothetical protein
MLVDTIETCSLAYKIKIVVLYIKIHIILKYSIHFFNRVHSLKACNTLHYLVLNSTN